MPYIKQQRRKELDYSLDSLLSEWLETEEDALAGELNYCFSKLAWALFQQKQKYVRANTIIGAFTAAQHEFYRRRVVPYEDSKINENGDLVCEHSTESTTTNSNSHT